ncbi:hypothetical protein [Shouchella lonarensis]|uniref:Uncharacterized protein n=1 Tax=Shouchella lonarensis TaxID=1464122 RepID=A0A1G6GMZ5_9BACI|nr:hypothetical protein [Shouchella lonarensis]SDB83341.1 hypothetical protein SAMN05421737_101274 [Shouchella lonarensis]
MTKQVTKVCMLVGCMWLLVYGHMHAVSGTDLMQAFSMRVTVFSEGTTYEWEYDNPNHFEYEIGKKVMKGADAKPEVERIMERLRLSEHTSKEVYAKRMKKIFPEMKKLEIRWVNAKSERYTWLWEKGA